MPWMRELTSRPVQGSPPWWTSSARQPGGVSTTPRSLSTAAGACGSSPGSGTSATAGNLSSPQSSLPPDRDRGSPLPPAHCMLFHSVEVGWAGWQSWLHDLPSRHPPLHFSLITTQCCQVSSNRCHLPAVCVRGTPTPPLCTRNN